MGHFRDLPIAKKINWSILLTSFSALLIAGLAIISYELATFRNVALHDLNILAGVVGTNCTGALAFEDTEAATAILGNLREEDSLSGARIFSRDGRPFASYLRTEAPHVALPEEAEPDKIYMEANRIRLFRSIRYREGDSIGTIYLDSSLAKVHARLWRYAGIIVLVIVLLFPLVFIVSIGLQRIITDPIKDLATVASSIAEQKNYSFRARKHSRDEIGRLTDSINHMLESIEARDTKLVQQADELWRSNNELEQFAYVSSHDLQEPLRKVTVYAQLLEQENSDNPKPNTRKYVENISASVARMRNLIHDLLSYSRIHGAALSRETVNLNDVVRQLLEEMEPTISQKNAVVSVGQLPVVEANASQMSQVFQNLISNALKFSGAAPRVEISSEQVGDEVVIKVADNGIGINEKYRDQIFKVFQRLHGKDEYPGTGIGLAICKKIIEQHGGKIWVDSILEKGSTFFFTLKRPQGDSNP